MWHVSFCLRFVSLAPLPSAFLHRSDVTWQTNVIPLQTLQQLWDRAIWWDSGQSKAGQPMFSTSFMVWSCRTTEKRCLWFPEDLTGKWRSESDKVLRHKWICFPDDLCPGHGIIPAWHSFPSGEPTRQPWESGPNTVCSHVCNTQTPRWS